MQDYDSAARAPGRIEFIGNHTDYNGGLVMGVAIDRGINVFLRRTEDGTLRFRSGEHRDTVTIPVDRRSKLTGRDSWVNYPLGVLRVLEEEGLVLNSGFVLEVASDLPSGAGLSSSAALELATAWVLSDAFGFRLERKRAALLCRRAENEFVGVPCGLLDQGVSSFGKKDSLVKIDCRETTFSTAPLPESTGFWLFNTRVKHALLDSLYATRHRECMDAAEWFRARDPSIRDLADVTPAALRDAEDDLDPVLFRRSRHVVEENERVKKMEQCLLEGKPGTAGQLLYASHASSSRLFENSCAELDFLVDRLSRETGVFGARLTGGGFGGAVVAWTNAAFSGGDAGMVEADYRKHFGTGLTVLQVDTDDGVRLLPGE